MKIIKNSGSCQKLSATNVKLIYLIYCQEVFRAKIAHIFFKKIDKSS